MMNPILLMVLSVLFAGCVYNTSDQKTFANTLASYDMRDGILATIKAQQEIHQPSCADFKLADARLLRRQDLIILEEWTIEACGSPVIYDVQIIQQNNKPRQFNVTRRQE